jgi:hypothetical protein
MMVISAFFNVLLIYDYLLKMSKELSSSSRRRAKFQ